MGYHAGVLKALEESDIDLPGADVIVGTSAGSIMASYLASGWTADDFYEYGHGRHPQAVARPEETDTSLPLFEPLGNGGVERARRAVGSAFALAASRGLWRRAARHRLPLPHLRKAFPSGMFSTETTRQRLYEDLPTEWPRKDLYITAVDMYSGERVAFGHPAAPEVPLPDAVLASTAIPGMFPPVRMAGRQYVDGGAASATSLDLAAHAGCDAILCVAPLGFRRDDTKRTTFSSPVFVRSFFARTLKKEVTAARALGIEVLVIRPWLSELESHGSNSMRHFDRGAVIEAARAGTLRLIEQDPDHPVLAAFRRTSERATG
jgi:NTE family protein